MSQPRSRSSRKYLPPRGALFALIGALLLSACVSSLSGPEVLRSIESDSRRVIFVTSNDWHTGISLAKADLPPGRIPETADFAKARFIEFGWGDKVFYPAKKTTIDKTLRAAIVPTSAVMHLVGLKSEPARHFQDSETIALRIEDKNLARLIDFIGASFARDDAPRATATGPGLYASSHFYPATGSFHMLNTCNTWTARALAAAGFGVDAQGTVRAEGVMRQIRHLAAQR